MPVGTAQRATSSEALRPCAEVPMSRAMTSSSVPVISILFPAARTVPPRVRSAARTANRMPLAKRPLMSSRSDPVANSRVQAGS